MVEVNSRCFVNESGECCGSGCFNLISNAYQCLCFVNACQFPPGDEVPCAIGLFGFFCYGGDKF